MNDKKREYKNNNIKNAIITIAIMICIVLSIRITQYKNKIELTQLGNTTQRQMMGYVLKTSKNEVIVIDGGLPEDTENLKQQIKKEGGKVDYWFITHPHTDHAGAFIEIAKNTDIEIGKIYTTYNQVEWYYKYANERPEEAKLIEECIQTLQSEKIKNKVETVETNQKIEIGPIHYEVLGVANPEITTNPANNSSMVLKMQINDKTLLFLGDSGKESGNKLLQNQKGKLKADIVQMSHHGQKGVTEEVYKEIKPKICLWATPDWLWNNDLGTGEDTGEWETKQTRNWMEKLGVKQNIIEKDGNQTITIY